MDKEGDSGLTFEDFFTAQNAFLDENAKYGLSRFDLETSLLIGEPVIRELGLDETCQVLIDESVHRTGGDEEAGLRDLLKDLEEFKVQIEREQRLNRYSADYFQALGRPRRLRD